MLGVAPQIVFDKAEAAWCFLIFVKTHNDTSDVAALGEQFVYLFFGGIER